MEGAYLQIVNTMNNHNTLCRHFGICGGCQFQDLPYDEQILRKEQTIKELAYAAGLGDIEIKPMNRFNEWFYRNKMEFTFSESNGQVVLGLHARGKHRVVFDVQECRIFSKDIGQLLESVRLFCRRHNYRAYHKFSHKGFLRHLIVREAKFTGEIMIGIVTTSEEVLDKDSFLRHIMSSVYKDRIASVYWIINDSFGDAVVFQKKELFYKNAFITEKLNDYYFKIYIDSFFQTNPAGIKVLYRKVKEYAPLDNTMKVLDLFCGVGCMGIFLASKAEFVWGVEIIESAVINAADNAGLNNVKNISFVCADVRKFLAQKDLAGNIDCVVLNPPRAGLSKKIKARITGLNASYLFYSSCNPNTLFADIKDLSPYYNIVFVEPFDFFPHTKHIETLVLLKRN